MRLRLAALAAVASFTAVASLVQGCGPDTAGESVNPSRSDAITMPACGTVLATFNGTSAYSNGDDTSGPDSCAGGNKYQCVELAMRYFDAHFGLSWYGDAEFLLDNAPTSTVDVFKNGDSAHPPVPGDMIVWEKGHVAIVTAVRDGAVDIIEQNVKGNGTATLPWDGVSVGARWTSWESGWTPAGWAHAKTNGGGGGGGGGGGTGGSGTTGTTGSTTSNSSSSTTGGSTGSGPGGCDNGVPIGGTACKGQGDAEEWVCLPGSTPGNSMWAPQSCNGGTCQGSSCTTSGPAGCDNGVPIWGTACVSAGDTSEYVCLPGSTPGHSKWSLAQHCTSGTCQGASCTTSGPAGCDNGVPIGGTACQSQGDPVQWLCLPGSTPGKSMWYSQSCNGGTCQGAACK